VRACRSRNQELDSAHISVSMRILFLRRSKGSLASGEVQVWMRAYGVRVHACMLRVHVYRGNQTTVRLQYQHEAAFLILGRSVVVRSQSKCACSFHGVHTHPRALSRQAEAGRLKGKAAYSTQQCWWGTWWAAKRRWPEASWSTWEGRSHHAWGPHACTHATPVASLRPNM